MTINGTEVTWDEITREQLKFLLVDEGLANSSIASMFNVSVSKVRYKRKKFNLSEAKIIYERFKKENVEVFNSQNEMAKEWLTDPQNIDIIAKSITQFIFRESPIEEVHSSHREITEQDMKNINIYMVNHIAGLLTYVLEGNWLQLRLLIGFLSHWSVGWNPAEAETSKIDDFFIQQTIKKKKKVDNSAISEVVYET